MSQKYDYVSLKVALASVGTMFKGRTLDESDLLDWAGQALGMLKIHAASQEAIMFSEIKDHHVELPPIHNIIQVAYDTQWCKGDKNNVCERDVVESIVACAPEEEKHLACPKYVEVDCHGYAKSAYEKPPVEYRARFDFANYYPYWVGSRIYQERFQLVTLADHTFFNSIVCQPKNNPYNNFHHDDDHRAHHHGHTGNKPEYTLVGGEEQRAMRFSMREGYVGISYTRAAQDEEGMPLIPDQEYALQAVSYYIAWKIHEQDAYRHTEGAFGLAQEAKREWRHYAGMFKSNAKMPHGEGQYLALREQSLYMLPRLERPYNFYGNMSDPEHRHWNNQR